MCFPFVCDDFIQVLRHPAFYVTIFMGLVARFFPGRFGVVLVLTVVTIYKVAHYFRHWMKLLVGGNEVGRRKKRDDDGSGPTDGSNGVEIV